MEHCQSTVGREVLLILKNRKPRVLHNWAHDFFIKEILQLQYKYIFIDI